MKLNFYVPTSAGDSPDYTVSTVSPLSLTPGHPNATITITIREDNIHETMESFIVALGVLSSVISLNESTVTVIIKDDGK